MITSDTRDWFPWRYLSYIWTLRSSYCTCSRMKYHKVIWIRTVLRIVSSFGASSSKNCIQLQVRPNSLVIGTYPLTFSWESLCNYGIHSLFAGWGTFDRFMDALSNVHILPVAFSCSYIDTSSIISAWLISTDHIYFTFSEPRFWMMPFHIMPFSIVSFNVGVYANFHPSSWFASLSDTLFASHVEINLPHHLKTPQHARLL